eukprot:TRINITY_DN60490_c0_g1_i2.p2 TRINITY_DN60490_c0_g1~~TRINITY_DN60490_c0_g1_i2.p2  ORF type:complete len:115 (+),score=20.41 TRINITY_DN60490_c0_g1_i2:815-1159(+)
MAVLQLDATGVDLSLQDAGQPNAHGVREIAWIRRGSALLRDRSQARWPLLRTMCALFGGPTSKPRNRSRSRERLALQPTILQLAAALQTPDVHSSHFPSDEEADSDSQESPCLN